MSMAKEEAIALSSTKVGTEHLLLALAKEEGIASEALQSLDISYDDVWTRSRSGFFRHHQACRRDWVCRCGRACRRSLVGGCFRHSW